MEVNYTDEKGGDITTNIEIGFNNISEADLQNAFKNCTSLAAVKFNLYGIQNYSLPEIQEFWKNSMNTNFHAPDTQSIITRQV